MDVEPITRLKFNSFNNSSPFRYCGTSIMFTRTLPSYLSAINSDSQMFFSSLSIILIVIQSRFAISYILLIGITVGLNNFRIHPTDLWQNQPDKHTFNQALISVQTPDHLPYHHHFLCDQVEFNQRLGIRVCFYINSPSYESFDGTRLSSPGRDWVSLSPSNQHPANIRSCVDRACDREGYTFPPSCKLLA